MLATPLAFALLALAVPVVLAYLHRRRRDKRVVSSSILFRALQSRVTATRQAVARPRHWLSLVLMLAVLAALVTGLAEVRSEAEQPRTIIVVLDTSVSMGAHDEDEPSRLEEGIAKLAELVATLSPLDRVALITTGAETRVRVGLTTDHRRLLAAARVATPAGDSSGVTAALRIADAMCPKPESPEPARPKPESTKILIVSDGVGVGSAGDTRCDVEQLLVGTAGPNYGITALSVREADALGLAEVHLGITSAAGGSPRQLEVELSLDGELIDVVSLDVPAGGEVEKIHRLKLGEGDWLSARLRSQGTDHLAADDEARAPRHAGRRVSVLLVAPPQASFVGSALQVHPRVDLTQAATVADYEPAAGTKLDLAIVEGLEALSREQAAQLPAAHLVVMGLPPDELGFSGGRQVEQPAIIRWSFDDPLFRFVDLADVEIPRAWLLPPTESSLIDTGEGSLAARRQLGQKPLVYLGFAPAHSDLVLRVAFVNLVANLVEWAAPREPAPAGQGGSYVISAAESRIAPQELPDATEWEPPTIAQQAAGLGTWQLLLLAALGLAALEGVLPALGWALWRLLGRRPGGPVRTPRLPIPKVIPLEPGPASIPRSGG